MKHNVYCRRDGLSYCRTCGADEELLLTYCPGKKLNADALMALEDGRVIDFMTRKRRKLMRQRLTNGDN